jgi:predicted transcriptional regulator
MPRPVSRHPTDLELEILKVLWETSPLTVREIRDALAANGRDLAHTSVITALGIMVDKGQLDRLPPVQGKAFRFAPRLKQEDVSRRMLGDLVDRVFDGSAEAVLLGLFDVTDLDEADVKHLRRLLNRKIREQNK